MKQLLFLLLLLLLISKIFSDLPAAEIEKKNEAIHKLAKKYGVRPKVVKAIIHVESRGKVSAVNKKSKDYGLLQINEHNIKKLKLDKERLLTDYFYSLEEGIKILSWFKNTYKHKLGMNWIGKYNCGTRPGCEKTRKSKKYIAKVLALL